MWNWQRGLGCLLIGWCGIATVRATPESWEALDIFQETLTRGELETKLDTIYAPYADWRSWIELTPTDAWIRTDADRPHRFYRLALKEPTEPTLDESRDEMLKKPLSEWKIAIDPGHLGGKWGPMERRSFRIGDRPVVQEGDLVLAAARRLAEGLRAHGAEVVLIREGHEPVTADRPEDFYLEAFRDLLRADQLPMTEDVRERAEGLFYLTSEIQARAERVNAEIRPDLVIALHIDAAPWEDPGQLAPVGKNGGHILVNGTYMKGELRQDDMRLAMLWRLLQGYSDIEVPLATSVAEAMAARTGLPAVTYTGKNASLVSDNPYVWARNLLANRIYDAPVIYLEPWMLNNGSVYAWATLGDYEGEKPIDGEPRPALPAVYAGFVLEGLLKVLGR